MHVTPIVGFTIATPGYFDLAYECAARIRRYAGIDCLILTSEDRQKGYELKFDLPRLAGSRVFLFMDADAWLIRDVSLDRFIGMEGFAAVPDPAALHPTFCQNDADVLNFPRERYCNTGVFLANSMDSRVIRAFDRATALLAEKRAGLHPLIQDVTEQSVLCKALFDEQLPTQFLPHEMNVYLHAAQYGHVDTIPARPLAVHAAGIPLHDKFRVLQQQAAVFSFA